MGTEGFVGFKYGKTIKGFHKSHDSYYGGLGNTVTYAMAQYHESPNDKMYNLLNMISALDDLNGGNGVSEDVLKNIDMSLLLNKLEEDFEFEDLYEVDGRFLWDGLACQYGYVVNLETNQLEVYRGRFTKPQSNEQEELKQYYLFEDNTIDKETGKSVTVERKFYTHLIFSFGEKENGYISEMFMKVEEDEHNVSGDERDEETYWELDYLSKII